MFTNRNCMDYHQCPNVLPNYFYLSDTLRSQITIWIHYFHSGILYLISLHRLRGRSKCLSMSDQCKKNTLLCNIDQLSNIGIFYWTGLYSRMKQHPHCVPSNPLGFPNHSWCWRELLHVKFVWFAYLLYILMYRSSSRVEQILTRST